MNDSTRNVVRKALPKIKKLAIQNWGHQGGTASVMPCAGGADIADPGNKPRDTSYSFKCSI